MSNVEFFSDYLKNVILATDLLKTTLHLRKNPSSGVPRLTLSYIFCSPALQAAVRVPWLLANPFLTDEYFHAVFQAIDPYVLHSGYLDTLVLYGSGLLPGEIVYPTEPFIDPATAKPLSDIRLTQGRLFDDE